MKVPVLLSYCERRSDPVQAIKYANSGRQDNQDVADRKSQPAESKGHGDFRFGQRFLTGQHYLHGPADEEGQIKQVQVGSIYQDLAVKAAAYSAQEEDKEHRAREAESSADELQDGADGVELNIGHALAALIERAIVVGARAADLK